MKIPQPLKKKDLVALTCPAGYMPAENAATCIQTLQGWGYQVLVGKTLGSKSKNYFSGSDEQRRDELQAMLDDENIKAIFFGRGGYGVSRIIDDLDFTLFKKFPKWLVGFSDITVLHSHLYKKFKIPSIHAQMAAAYNGNGVKTESIAFINKILTGKKNKYVVNGHKFNNPGKAEGTLVGGNLTLFTNMIGTASDVNTKNCILFLEDIGELLYSTDRLLQQLKRSGKLKDLAGLVFGGFTDGKDTERKFGKSIDQILKDISADLEIPVCFHFPISHGKENLPVKVGAKYSLTVTDKRVTLQEA